METKEEPEAWVKGSGDSGMAIGPQYVHFYGLSVEIGERVLRVWSGVPAEERTLYWLQASEIGNARELARTWYWHADETGDAPRWKRAILKRKRRRRKQPEEGTLDDYPLILGTPVGPPGWKKRDDPVLIKRHELGMITPAEVELIRAYRDRDKRKGRQKFRQFRSKHPEGGDTQAGEQEDIKDVLCRHWVPLTRGKADQFKLHTLGLIWFSYAALARLLEHAGWCGYSAKAIEHHVGQLKLPKLERWLVDDRNVDFREPEEVRTPDGGVFLRYRKAVIA